jgi:hypothetical protein
VQKTPRRRRLAHEDPSATPHRHLGYGEGGLLALHTATSTSASSTAVSGYLPSPREQLWEEPLYPTSVASSFTSVTQTQRLIAPPSSSKPESAP